MSTVFDQTNLGARVARASALCLLALAATLFGAREARAQWTAPDAQGNINSTNTGNVGIGTAAPGSKVVISANAANPLAPNPGNPSVLAPQDGTILHIVNADSQKTRVTIDSFGNSSGPSVSFRAGRGTLAAPAATLSGDALGIVYGGGFGVSRFHNGAKPAMWMVATENWTDTAAGSAIYFNTVQNGTTATVERMRINHDGNVGIGTAAPTDRLEINGNAANGAGLTISTAGNAKYRTGTVGTTVPNWGGQFINAKFNEAAGNWTLDDASLNAAFFKLDLRPHTFGNEIAFYRMAAGANPRPDTAWTPMAQFKLDTGNVLLAPSAGRVGIGTSAPATALHVVGDITVTGNINAKYQDVAEWVPSTEKMAAGTVVVVNAEAVNHVQTSTSAYATSVAGVISPQPGLILGEAGEGKALVATTGRVKVKVDATRAPIRAGDLLVTSDVPGVAMRSEPVSVGGVQMHRPGTIIGKALEPLAKGTGEILVLLSLQ